MSNLNLSLTTKGTAFCIQSPGYPQINLPPFLSESSVNIRESRKLRTEREEVKNEMRRAYSFKAEAMPSWIPHQGGRKVYSGGAVTLQEHVWQEHREGGHISQQSSSSGACLPACLPLVLVPSRSCTDSRQLSSSS